MSSNPHSAHTPSLPASNPQKSAVSAVYYAQPSSVTMPYLYNQLNQISHTVQSYYYQETYNIYGVNPQEPIKELIKHLYQHCMPYVEYVMLSHMPYVLLDLSQLQSVNPQFYAYIYATPDILLLFGDLSLRHVMYEYYYYQLAQISEYDRQRQEIVQLFNHNVNYIKNVKLFARNAPVSYQISLRSLSPFFIDKLIYVDGLLINKSEIIPEASLVVFTCYSCRAEYSYILTKQTINMPHKCYNCNSSVIKINYDKSEYVSKVSLKIQESPNSTTSGETPVNIICYALELYTREIKCGDSIQLTCIYRVSGERLNQTHSSIRAYFKPFLDVLWIDVIKKMENKSNGSDILNAELRNFQDNNIIPSDIYELIPYTDSETDFKLLNLINSIAPSIYGQIYYPIKLSLLLQAIQGNKYQEYRSNIHILLVGDPGYAKSQLIKFMTQITPRSIYTSGKNSSYAGLTATVTKNQGFDYQLEPGTLVLCNNGLCALDEFDKLDPMVKGVLHECMEQQTVSVAKAGVVCSLQAQTAILAAANPVDSKYNPKKTVMYNINLDASLISRFDLIFLLLDVCTEEMNRRLANHLLSLYFAENGDQSVAGKTIPVSTLQRYIYLAREKQTALTPAARTELEYSYLELRKLSSHNRIAATPRYLLAIMRLAQARAKLRFSEYVTETDVRVARQLLSDALQKSATDENGLLDIKRLNFDKGIDWDRIDKLSKSILLMLEYAGEVEMTQLIERLGGYADVIEQAIRLLTDYGHVARARNTLFLVK